MEPLPTPTPPHAGVTSTLNSLVSLVYTMGGSPILTNQRQRWLMAPLYDGYNII